MKDENTSREKEALLLVAKVLLFLESLLVMISFWEVATSRGHDGLLGFGHSNTFMPIYLCCAYYWAGVSWPLIAWLPRKKFFKMEVVIVTIGVIGYILGILRFVGGFYYGSNSYIDEDYELLYCLFFVPHGISLLLTFDYKLPSKEKAVGAIVVNNISYSYKLWYRDAPFEAGYKGGRIDTIYVSKDNKTVFSYSNGKIKTMENENLEEVLENINSKYD